jgi:hypothetical protein
MGHSLIFTFFGVGVGGGTSAVSKMLFFQLMYFSIWRKEDKMSIFVWGGKWVRENRAPPLPPPIMEVTFIFLGNKKITSREMFYLYVRKDMFQKTHIRPRLS